MVRVRFAPSPTGYLHVGNARTALFNYLFARKNNGVFVLRIEDTDFERSKKEYEQSIIEDLKWLGLSWDEGPDCGGPYGPYRQSERLQIYRDYGKKLLTEGKAYKCWCTKEEIEQRIQGDKSSGYDNYCRNLTHQQIAKFESEGRKYVIRFKVPEKDITVNDIIRGTVKFESGSLNDFVIMKSNEIPTFHFAVVIDDLLMNITHVIRGEDHLSNTPKHILIFEALGYQAPQFAHMSMTLGPDRTRLSKRHGATSVRQYRENGYLADAMFNYLALLGWSSKDNREIFSHDELIQNFSLENCNRANAIFDPVKLLWFNSLYIRNTSSEKLALMSIPFFEKSGYSETQVRNHLSLIEKVIELEKEKLKTLADIPERTGYFIKENIEWNEKLTEKFLTDETTKILTSLLQELKKIEIFQKEIVEHTVRRFCEEKGIKASTVFHPLRFALTGTTKGPGLFEIFEFLGKDTSLSRIENFIKKEENNDDRRKNH